MVMHMTRRRKIVLIIVGVLVIVGLLVFIFGPYVYRDYIVGKAPVTPAAELPANSTTTLSPDDLAGTWTVAGGSYAGYRVNEALRGVDATVVGRTEKVTGQVTVNDLTLSSGRISVDTASIATDQSARDDFFRGNVLNTSAYPTATFELTKPLKLPADLTNGQRETVELAGKLTIHGVTRSVTMQVEVGLDGEQAKIAGSIPVTFADYGVTAPDLGFVRVESSGSVEFLLQLAFKDKS